MDRIRKTFKSSGQYEPLQENGSRESLLSQQDTDTEVEDDKAGSPFSWLEYVVFLLLGVAMLWAWNMFLAAAPYFMRRFQSDEGILRSFQASEISVSTITNLVSMIVLTRMQAGASYTRRIITSLVVTTICFVLLAISTAVNVSAKAYFAFLMVIVCLSSSSTGLIQNGLFAYAAGFGRNEYTQAIMTGQAIAGVLPCVAQIASVYAIGPPKHHSGHPDGPPPGNGQAMPPPPPSVAYRSARIYFILAICVAVIALSAFLFLLYRRQHQSYTKAASFPEPTSPNNPTEASMLSPSSASQNAPPKPIPMLTLFRLLPSFSIGVFLCFSLTMLFPVFATIIPSLNPETFPPPIFVPLSFLLWNLGDLLGRLLTLIPALHLYHHPFSLFCIAMARLIFIPLYFLCNIRGNGAIVNSDAFYLIVVQMGFGLSNGYLGSECMMGAGEWVKGEDEKRAAGAWMGLCLVAGLTVGSLCSFAVVQAV